MSFLQNGCQHIFYLKFFNGDSILVNNSYLADGTKTSSLKASGEDWYEVEKNGMKQYVYTEFTSQEKMDRNGIQGKYLGEVVLAFVSKVDEQLGTNGKMDGKGANSATATIYSR